MFLLDSLMIAGIRWALETTITAAEAEMNDDTALREQLLAAEMSREMGEISDDEFAEIEADLLARIREIKERREGGLGPIAFGAGEPLESSEDSRFQIEASVSGDFHDPVGAPHTTVVETTPMHGGTLFQTEGDRSIEVLDMEPGEAAPALGVPPPARSKRSNRSERSNRSRTKRTTRTKGTTRTKRTTRTTRTTRTVRTTGSTRSRSTRSRSK
jgi:hypothetical protein